jgi:two-component system alkaline phosphatase synthesis response regulator PhoP
MKVLIIDDDKFLTTLLESELHQANIEVAIASSGDDGIKKAKDWKPNVVVLDLILPKTDGFEVLEKIHNLPEAKHTTIFIFSTLAQEHDKSEALSLGAKAYFMKGENTVHNIVEAICALPLDDK